MSEPAHHGKADRGELSRVVSIVSAFVSHNSLPQGDLASFIMSVHTALRTVGEGPRPAANQPAAKEPAVQIRKSVTPEFIVCLEDGRKFKSLRRHLHTAFGLTPDAYRAKWGLPHDYPMVAPAYAAKRSELAKKAGLGVKRQADEPTRKGKRKAAAKAETASKAA